jgi:molecular chaperone GrpE
MACESATGAGTDEMMVLSRAEYEKLRERAKQANIYERDIRMLNVQIKRYKVKILQQTRPESVTRRIIRDLLPVIDYLERAIAQVRRAGGAEGIVQQLENVRLQALTFLRSHGVEAFTSVGRAFDPTRHMAVDEVETGRWPDRTVVEEVRPGYVMNSQVIRPALVKVSRNQDRK